MAGRANSQRRGGGGRGGNFKGNNDKGDIRSRLGHQNIPNLYHQRNNINNDRSKKFKYVRTPTTAQPSIATLPAEVRIRALSRRFLKSYYEIFDQPGRVNLESQYSADAFFSFSATYPTPTFGRNLLEVREPEHRISLLIHDKTNIARALATFSPTEHFVSYLSYDVPFYIVNPMSVISMHIVVNGVFRDTSQETNALKAFTRVFVLKLVSIDKSGDPNYEIFNDLFMLQVPTPDQIKRYHQESKIIKAAQASTTGSASNEDSLTRQQQGMLDNIMVKTKMNKRGSLQLLKDCEWNESRSLEVFNQLFGANKIPQDLFTS